MDVGWTSMVSILMSKLTFPYHPYHPYPPLSLLSPLSPLIILILLISSYPFWEHLSLCFLFSYGVLPPSKSGRDKLLGSRIDFHGSGLDFLWISWIWGGCSMEFMDFDWMTMDPDWIFYGFPCIRTGFSTSFFDLGWIFHEILGFRIDFHWSGLDFLWISWI